MYLDFSGIYQIRNINNNKIYIGSTINFRKRQNRHFSELYLGKHFNNHLQASFNKNKNNFVFEILLFCEPFELEMYEQYFLDTHNPEYNQRKLANSNLGIIRDNEFRTKISKAQKGIPKDNGKIVSLANLTKRNYKNTSTGFRGVYPANDKFRSRITLNKRIYHLGIFDTPIKAHEIYLDARNKYLEDGRVPPYT